jgi:HAD superfamily hydrolase (TIGR01509 family)
VLFDMDGLLVDTEPLWLEAETEVMARLGYSWTKQDQEQLLGGSMARTVSYILGKATVPATAGEVERWMLDGMLARAAAGRVKVLPGARELLAEVARAGIPHALVTSSVRIFAEAVLEGTALTFPVTVTGDDVKVTKPDPAPYLEAARRLNANPRQCVALEDSPNGVASATAAGCHVIAVPSQLPIKPARGVTVLSSLSSINVATLRGLAEDRQEPRF